MWTLTAETAIQYAESRPELRHIPFTAARLLGGGVSNAVVMLEGTGPQRLVLKQSLGRLRVEQEWLADQSRILRESASMAQLAPLLPAGAVPRVWFTDAANFIYGMEAAPEGAQDWKARLLAGVGAHTLADHEQSARAVARILAALINVSFGQSAWQSAYGDQHCFDQLRMDPYYRFTAACHPALAPAFEECIERCSHHACALVHGDFSPKNILIPGGLPAQPILIDFEVIHYGDPAFDAAFLLNHLLLKATHGVAGALQLGRVFWRELAAAITQPVPDFERATIRHLGCLHLARVDGKSPAEYLTAAERERVRAKAVELIRNPPHTIEEVFAE